MNIIKRISGRSNLNLAFSNIVRQFSSSPINQQTPNPNDSSKSIHSVQRERCLNVVNIIGRVGSDPKFIEKGKTTEKVQQKESETTQDYSNKAAVFQVATSEYAGMDEKGNPKFRVDWHHIVVNNERIKLIVQKYVRKGDRLQVTGRLHYNLTKDKSGESKSITNIIADDLIFFSKNPEM